jgi:hypothetical protein
MSVNQGSTSLRNIPDVSLLADNIWVVWDNGSQGSFGGTSAATPLWAGFMALVNQQALANGHATIGFANPALYALAKSTNYSACFHDIRTGNNMNPSSPSRFSAVNGYDLCTGWGTPAGQALINALAGGTNLPPVFASDPFSAPSATVGRPCSGSIAGQASDPNPGEQISFAKLSGPAWLTVSASGDLSGDPTSANIGTNEFIVSVSDPAGLSNTATMFLKVSAAPGFVADPFILPAVVVGQTYSGSITNQASNPNGGTPLVFLKISGPNWLVVSSDGSLSGLPGIADVGTNSFTVAVSDANGLSSTATMRVPVLPPISVVLHPVFNNNNLVLSWNYSNTLLQVQVSTNLASDGWANVGLPTSSGTAILPPVGPTAFYRIVVPAP